MFEFNGPNYILRNGDCLEMLRRMPDDSVDLFVTDPPYEIKNTRAGGKSEFAKSIQKMNDELESNNIVNGFDAKVLDEMTKVCNGINMYFFCNKAQIPMYLDYFVTGLKCSFDLIKWVKTNAAPTFNNKYLSDTEYCVYVRKKGYCNPGSYADASTLYNKPMNTRDKKKWGHPTIKPVELIDRLVRNSSKPGAVICDPYMGSGAVGVSAVGLGRLFIGSELSPKWFGVACERLSLESIDDPVSSGV